MAGKGLQGQYAGFISRTIAFVGDLLVIILVLIVVNAVVQVPLDLFFGIDLNACPAVSSWQDLLWPSTLLCYGAKWLQVALVVVIPPGYFVLFWALGGQTLVQYAMGLRVVRVDGKRMTVLRSLARWLGYFVSFVALGLGFLWVLWDDRRQGFHDKLVKTVVIYAWEARQNEFLLDRIRGKLRRKKAAPAGEPVAAVKPVRLELVLSVFPTMARVNSTMGAIEDAVRQSALAIVSSVVFVKDETGAVGYVGASDLAAGDRSDETAAVLAGDPRLGQIRPEDLLADVPDSSFVLLIFVEDTHLMALLKTLTGVKVASQVFDLDVPAHKPIKVPASATRLPDITSVPPAPVEAAAAAAQPEAPADPTSPSMASILMDSA
jgi:uncharacterized RDD family membrane protein YckC